MAITDAERHRLHTKLDQILGEEEAAILISHLPPSGWSDVARQRDLDELELRLTLRFEAALEKNLREQANRFLVGVGALLTVATTIQTLLVR